MPKIFHEKNFHRICDTLAKNDPHLKQIIVRFDYPPMWQRDADFETLIHIILEQQVSLASAKAALLKLKEKIGAVKPEKLLGLTDAEMKGCYFSRQKTLYARDLAQALLTGRLTLDKLPDLPDLEIRGELKKIKGIGDWTVDIYLLIALHRTDVFPLGDLAMVNSLKKIKQLPSDISRDELLQLSLAWKPYRSIATMLLWHHYLSTRPSKT